MQFEELSAFLFQLSGQKDFDKSSECIERFVEDLPWSDFVCLLQEIGTIPEAVEPDSSCEKLFAKAADIFLARCFRELGLSAAVVKSRANCADVVAKSKLHGYSLVADAKAFRLSRTAKNQKDFKVQSMVHWKQDADFAVLVCPLFHYPKYRSQIYMQALAGNVFLFSWEHFAFLLRRNVEESESFNLAKLWNISKTIARKIPVSQRTVIYWEKQDALMCELLNVSYSVWQEELLLFRRDLVTRGVHERAHYEKLIAKIRSYSREKAIDELIGAMKIKEKLNALNKFVSSLEEV